MTDASLPKAEVNADQKAEVENTTNVSSRILASVLEYLVLIPLKDREEKKYVENVILDVLEDAHHPSLGTVQYFLMKDE